MNNNNTLQNYIKLVEFWGKVLGENCEIILHDISKVDNSIIAISNGQISGRGVGGSLTDLGLMMIKKEHNVESDALINYTSKMKNGKTLRSSTFLIRDEGNVIGALCINIDIYAIKETEELVSQFIEGVFGSEPTVNQNDLIEKDPEKETENIHASIEDMTTSIIMNALSEVNVHPSRMSSFEKTEVVQKLYEKGVFLIKGSVVDVSYYLEASEATIYRYLSKISNNSS